MGQANRRPTCAADSFRQQMRDFLLSRPGVFRSVNVANHETIYASGDQDDTVYCIERGQVKVEVLSPQGKACIVSLYGRGDVFGELCVSGLLDRMETAVAMEEADLKLIPRSQFLMCLSRESLLEGFVKYLATRLADQQQVILSLTTRECEYRLATTLLKLVQRLGRIDDHGVRIEPRISHEELSRMVGTTRPRISVFMHRFRELGLVETSVDHFLIVKKNKLNDYLAEAVYA